MVLIFASKDWRIKGGHNQWARECDEENRTHGCHYLQNARYDEKVDVDPSKWF